MPYSRRTDQDARCVRCQLFFYALRPLFVKPKPAGMAEAVNLLTCAAYDAAMFYYAVRPRLCENMLV